MPRASAQAVLQDLAEMHDLMNEHTGKINYSAMSRRTGIPHPTLIRIMQAGPDHRINADTADKLMRAFQLTFAQVRGDVPVRKARRSKFEPTDRDLELLRSIKALPRDAQADVERLVQLRAELADDASDKPRKRRR